METVTIKTSSEFDIKEFFSHLSRRKVYIIVSFLFMMLLFLIGSYRLNRVYESSTTVLIEDNRAFNQQESHLIEGSQDQQWRIRRLIRIKNLILSYEYLKELITELALDKNPKIRKLALAKSSALNGLTPDEIIERWVIEDLRKSLNIIPGKTDVFTINARANDPDKAYLIAKTISRIFIEKSYSNQINGLEQTIDFSAERLAYYQKKLEESEKKLQNYKAKNKSKKGSSENIKKYQQLLFSTNYKISELNKKIYQLKKQINPKYNSVKINPNASTRKYKASLQNVMSQILTVIVNQNINSLRLMRLNEQLNNLFSLLKKEYKEILNHQLNINDVNIIAEIKTTELELQYLEKRKIALQNLIKTQLKQIQNASDHQFILSIREQEVKTNRELYNSFLQRSRALQTEGAFQRREGVYTYKIIEPAQKPLYAIKPNKKMLVAFGSFVGIVIGVIIVGIMTFFDRSFYKVEDVENYLSKPVVCTILKLPLHRETNKAKQLFSKRNFILCISAIAFILIIIFLQPFWDVFLRLLNFLG